MEKYLKKMNDVAASLQSSAHSPKTTTFQRRGARKMMMAASELMGGFNPKCRGHFSSLLLQSYSQIGAFPHLYNVNGVPCPTHQMNQIGNISNREEGSPISKHGISSLEFDSKGVYLVSVTKSGCLMVLDFESLYSQTLHSFPCMDEDESKHVFHISLHQQLDSVGWNSAYQDEIACTSTKTNEVLIFDIGYDSSDPAQVLKTRRTVTVHGNDIRKGLTDVAFSTDDKSRLVSSDTNGAVHVWDRRMSVLPCLELATNNYSSINSVKLNVDNQMIFGGDRRGTIYMWDFRGGRASSGFQSHREVCHPPAASWKLASMLEKIGPLKAQSNIVSKEVHSITFDPSCPHHLAFHLDDGWSGILNTHNFQITHIHCPPPAWLNDANTISNLLYFRKPSWLPALSIYVIGSSSDNGIHLLDFYPDRSSPCHVDYREDTEIHSGMVNGCRQNRFVPLSESVTTCATHPLNGTIVAGTKNSSLLIVSQQKHSIKGD
ncbi:hypothetical protein K2173_008794 [Erythroxylum novogranatense]|uniref:Transducin/WD40 repeat-like superfamily protein n=1 Tax=Erythroxylum novogranatense TaxID=1862640 RepID=A0AAV8SZ71_9ROSI|nr:hypothetical protein K2173_008794 [Erythroxylum novogranatense]